MARSNYKISLTPSGTEIQWRDFWEKGFGQNPGITETLTAENQREAERAAREKHPGFTVMKDGSGRIGNA